VRTVVPGDRVVLTFYTGCGACAMCLRGRPSLCRADDLGGGCPAEPPAYAESDILRYANLGSFAEYACVTERAVTKVGAAIAPQHRALLGCGVLTGFGAVVHTAKVSPGSTVLVFGAGGVGLTVVMTASLAGAAVIAVFDRDAARRDAALACGATHFFPYVSGDGALKNVLHHVLPGVPYVVKEAGFDFVFEATGNVDVQQIAHEMVHPGGSLVLVGVAPFVDEVKLRTFETVYQQRAILGTFYGASVPRADVALIARLITTGRMPIDRIPTHLRTLDDINTACEDVLKSKYTGRIVIMMAPPARL
jgi:S-(hydroxymethyl)glutathione dehydrogenase/alcohol dehydrogenase